MRVKPRGQNLMLLALGLLFLVLMVTMTLGLGMRIRQNHELQNLSDTAAYSNAVMVARAHNNAALINRLEVSYFVAQAADQSLISWTSYGWGMGIASSNLARAINTSPCNGNNDEAAVAELQFFAVAREFVDRGVRYKAMDEAAGLESKNIQSMIGGLRRELRPGISIPAPNAVQERLYDAVRSQTLTRQVVTASGVRGISVVPAARTINRREVDCDFGGVSDDTNSAPPGGPGLCSRATWNQNMLAASMGTRGSYFVTGRGVAPPAIVAKLNAAAAAAPGTSVTISPPVGSAYWAPWKSHGDIATTTEAWADDHGSVTVTVRDRTSACSQTQTMDVEAFVRSTHWVDGNDQHRVTPGPPDSDADTKHTMGDCTPLCPSVWVRSLGFEPSSQADDAYGQPKQVVALQRDFSVTRFPWELHFSFPFSRGRPPQGWDARGDTLHTRVGSGQDISRGTAIGTAMAYYHRANRWDEFPNLLNPFWRATLVPMDVDRTGDVVRGGTDVPRVLGAPEHALQRDAHDALIRAGYRGLH